MKRSLVYENGELIYYENDVPRHAGVIRYKGAIYYISSKGRAVKGRHIVHKSISNGILKHGSYKFGDDYKLIKGSYVKPERVKGQRHISKKKMRLIAIVAGILCLALLAFSAVYNKLSDVAPENAGQKGTDAVRKVSLPVFDEPVVLMSELAHSFVMGEVDAGRIAGTRDAYRPLAFEYNLGGKSGTLILRENNASGWMKEYKLTADANVIEIDNLKTGTKYTYTVRKGDDAYAGAFETANGPRLIRIGGLNNARDIGGYDTVDGKRVRQGLIIRGSEIDGIIAPDNLVNAEQARQIQDTFGFVYEMDLRSLSVSGGAYTSRLGANVRHKFYAAPQYAQIFNESFKESLKSIFSDLSKKENYPMYMSCTWGKDRTGTIVFLLQGVLNVSEKDMLTEYRLSAFTDSDIASSTALESVINMLASYEGATLQEKIVTYLTDVIGVTEAEIAMIREILLETK